MELNILSPGFVSSHKATPDGAGTLFHPVYTRTYSRLIPELGRREIWPETVARVVEYSMSLYSGPVDPDKIAEEAKRMFDAIYNLKVLPAGRTLWVGGTTAAKRFPESQFNCFQADTEFITKYGQKKFSDFSDGDTVTVLTRQSGWKRATIRKFGKEEIFSLILGRGKLRKEIFTTGNHRWLVRDYEQDYHNQEMKTTELQPGSILPMVYAERNNPHFKPCNFGIAHGMVYGDGSYDKDRENCRIVLCDDSQQFSNFFPQERLTDVGSRGGVVTGRNTTFTGLPSFFKTLPSLDLNVEYLYGFLAGWFAADGSYSGTNAVLSCADKEALEWARSAFTICGIYTSQVRMVRELSPFDGSEAPLYEIGLYRHGLRENFLLKDSHKEFFQKPSENLANWKVVSVNPTGRVEDVWCVQEPETQTFVLADGVLTRNCSFTVIDDMEAFGDLFHMLLCGSGVGFRVLKGDVVKVPNLRSGVEIRHNTTNILVKSESDVHTEEGMKEFQELVGAKAEELELGGYNVSQRLPIYSKMRVDYWHWTDKLKERLATEVMDYDPFVFMPFQKELWDQGYSTKEYPIAETYELVCYKPLPLGQRLQTTTTSWQINPQNLRSVLRINVGDSKESWVQSLRIFLDELSHGVADEIEFDYDSVRPQGELIKTFGGRAAGPQGMWGMYKDLEQVLRRCSGKIGPVDAVDICNIIALNVVVGGTRRSSQIALGSQDDTDFIEMKRGLWTDPSKFNLRWRVMSNNSVTFLSRPTKEQLQEIFKYVLVEGEPGFFNLEAARKRRPWAEGLNPCAEILLDNRGVCNLSTVNMRAFVDDELKCFKTSELMEAVRLAVRIGLRQTNVVLTMPKWSEVQQRDRLTGVSVTGMMDALDAVGWDFDSFEVKFLFAAMNDVANHEALEYAKELRVPAPLLVTAIKPEGTISQLPTVSSGLHRAYAPYYIRRIRVSAIDPVCQALRDLGVPNQPDKAKSDRIVFEFPIKTDTTISANDESAIDQLKRYYMLQENYTDHNSSCTLTFDKTEVNDLIDMIYDNWDNTVAIALLPKNDIPYPLAPYEAITEEEYLNRKKDFPDMSKLPEIINMYERVHLDEETELDEDPACARGACPVR